MSNLKLMYEVKKKNPPGQNIQRSEPVQSWGEGRGPPPPFVRRINHRGLVQKAGGTRVNKIWRGASNTLGLKTSQVVARMIDRPKDECIKFKDEEQTFEGGDP